MITDPERVASLAVQQQDENWRFRSFLLSLRAWSDAKLNRMSLQFGRAAAAQIDCVECGACCRGNIVPVLDEEIERLAFRVRLPVLDFRARFVRAIKDHPQALDAHPCAFQEGKRCTVYDDRPDPCRGYPYVDADVRDEFLNIMERATVCPIVFEQLEQLKAATGFRAIAGGEDGRFVRD